jgi:hypothetical protein
VEAAVEDQALPALAPAVLAAAVVAVVRVGTAVLGAEGEAGRLDSLAGLVVEVGVEAAQAVVALPEQVALVL